MFVILQKYDFSSKSQRKLAITLTYIDVCDTAKVRFFKQITTSKAVYAFSSWCLWYCKSTIFQANHNRLLTSWRRILDVCDTAKVRFFKQITTIIIIPNISIRCLWYCKSTIFQANHNVFFNFQPPFFDVCDTAKVRFFKQITTCGCTPYPTKLMFVILQKYDFSSKSQREELRLALVDDVCDTAKVRFFKQITTDNVITLFFQ